jgi:methyl-accepting chemotaxis protein
MNAPPAPAGVPRRHLGNYLLDKRLQLKGALLTVGAAALVALLLGVFLWRTSAQLLEEAQKAVEARSQAAQTSKELGAAALSNQLLERFDDPTFPARLRELSTDLDARYERERDAIIAQHEALKRQQRAMDVAILGGLALLLGLVVLFSIVTTHRIAGPLYRLKVLMGQVGNAPLSSSAHLRKKDELQELFQEFTRMLDRIRDSQRSAAGAMQHLIDRARAAQVPSDLLEDMKALRSLLEKRPLSLDDTSR